MQISRFFNLRHISEDPVTRQCLWEYLSSELEVGAHSVVLRGYSLQCLWDQIKARVEHELAMYIHTCIFKQKLLSCRGLFKK